MTQSGATPPVPPPSPTGGSGSAYSQPATQANPGAKQGMPLWAKIAIGCGCLTILAIMVVVGLLVAGGKKAIDIAKEAGENPATAIEWMVKVNPDIELVETDEDAQTITIRDKESGEVATFDFSDIKNGNFSFEGADGSKFSVRGQEGKAEVVDQEGNVSRFGAGQDLEDLPSWLHLYPDTPVQVGYTHKGGGQAAGTVSQQTDDSLDDVAAHFEEYFESQDWNVTRSQMSNGGDRLIVVTGNSEDGKYTLGATASRAEDGKTSISLSYSGPES